MLHDKSNGYLRNKTAEDLAEEIHRLAELQPEDVPTERMFLLEVDSGKLSKEHVETQAYLSSICRMLACQFVCPNADKLCRVGNFGHDMSAIPNMSVKYR